MQYSAIVFTLLIAAISCRPQGRLVRPSGHQSLGPTARGLSFHNSAPAPLAASEPQNIPIPIPVSHASRKVPSSASAPAQPFEPSDYEVYQNQNARYEFSSAVEDHINDLTQQRQEVREGSSVKGMYSYSDGYFKRTVHYIADENGYRVTGMEAEPLDGPHIDLSGSASVSSNAHGTELRYKVVSVPVDGPVAKVVEGHINPQFE